MSEFKQALASLAIVVSLLPLVACAGAGDKKDVLVVGYVGGLSGKASSLGIAARDGALLAVEEANATGGVAGRRVVLKVADDGKGAASAAEGVRELDRMGAVAIVGPVLSASAATAVPIANELRVPLVSPCVSSGDFTNLDDYFIRVYPDNRWAGERLTREFVIERKHRRISVIYDLSNRSYSETQYLHFRELAEEAGASFAETATFTSGENPDYTALAKRLLAPDPDCVLIVANAIDTAMLCQRIRAAGATDLTIIGTPWSATDDLISSGGTAVEGLMYLDTIDLVDSTPRLDRFMRDFQIRFGYKAGFSAIHAYEAMSIILSVAEKDDSSAAIKQALVGHEPFEGLQSLITINDYGDADRDYHPTVVTSKGFRPLPNE